MASIYDLLRADHAMHIQWLVELQNGLSSGQAEHAFSRLKEALRLHTEFENGVFYPTLRVASGAGQQLADSIRDHTQIQKLLSELSDLDVTFPEWQDIIDELMPMVKACICKHAVSDRPSGDRRQARRSDGRRLSADAGPGDRERLNANPEGEALG